MDLLEWFEIKKKLTGTIRDFNKTVYSSDHRMSEIVREIRRDFQSLPGEQNPFRETIASTYNCSLH